MDIHPKGEERIVRLSMAKHTLIHFREMCLSAGGTPKGVLRVLIESSASCWRKYGAA